MKKISKIFLLAMIAFAPVSFAKDLKIGVVNVPRVLEESPQAESARSALQREFEPRERALLALQQDIRKLEERLNRDGAIMSEAERSKLQRDIVSKQRDFKRDQDAFRDDLNFKRSELLENLQRQLVDSVRTFAEKEKFDLLLAEGVLYVSDEYNVTEKVLDHLKSKR